MDGISTLANVLYAHRGELVRVARREGLGPEDAVDCVQNALCKLLTLSRTRAVPSADREALAFVRAIVKNAARNERRLHRLARPHVGLDGLEPVEGSAETILENAETHVRLQVCVSSLCSAQKAVVTLRLLEERDGEDVAEALGISRAYVDVLLFRARAALRECMDD